METCIKQKFNKGDYVHIVKDLGHTMSHFNSDCDAIVIGSYKDQFGGNDSESYTVHIKNHGKVYWYFENQLIMIEPSRLDLLDKWEAEQENERKQKSDLDWIFSHGQEVIDNRYGASVEALAECLGVKNLWGNHGEGITYYSNSMIVLQLALEFLITGNKNGWIDFAKKFKDNK